VHRKGCPKSERRWPRNRVLAAAALVLLAVLSVYGCGSSGSSSSTASTSTGSGAEAEPVSSSDGSDGASAAVAKWTAPVTSYELPTTPIKELSKLKGKTIYYIPISQQVPEFAIVAESLKAALSAAGMQLQICDGGANPSQTSACVSQAVKTGAAGVMTAAIPYELAQNTFETAKAQGLKIIIEDQLPESKFEETDSVAYQNGIQDAEMQQADAAWIAEDSGGDGNVLVNEVTDSPSSQGYIEKYGLPELGKLCSSCSTVTNKISTANTNLVAGTTSSALVANPETGYVWSEFDQFLEPTQAGVQQAGYADKVKGVSADALLSGLQMLASEQYLYADSACDFAYQGWATADQMIRMLLGMPTPEENVPVRLFTRENVKEVELTEEAQNDGSWFGPTTFPEEFEKLWGVG
jgi:ribose transport system substrate-binding protein